MNDDSQIESTNHLDFLSGGGYMGDLIRSYNWANSSLGDIESWSSTLRSALSICVGSAFPIALYWGNDLTLLYNDEWSPILGKKHPWALGRPGVEVWPEIWDAIEPLFNQVKSTGEAIRSKDGLLLMHRHGYTEECYFDFTFSPIRGEGGSVYGIFNAVVETTYRVINERRTGYLKNLSQKVNQGKSIEEICQLASVELELAKEDIPFCLIYINDELSQQTILKAAIRGTENPLLAPPILYLEDQKNAWPFLEAFNQSVLVVDLKSRFGELPGGSWPEPSQEALIVPISQANKTFGFYICGISPRRKIDTDYQSFIESIANYISVAIANVKAYEEERKRTKALEEIDKAKTVFFSNISHEFRTPLTLMLGPLEEVLDQNDSIDAEGKEQIQTVHRNSLRLLKLVNNLLDFSRIEAGRTQPLFRQTDICSLTIDLASTFRSAIEKEGIKLTVETSNVTDPIYVDHTMWERIIFNLLSNALKFTFIGEIFISITQEGNQLSLTVKDSGIGISEEELPKLFSRFHRVENALGRTHEGSGIGLAMVQELVKLHGGTVRVESKLEEGSSFIILIPTGKEHLNPSHIADPNSKIIKTLNALPSLEEEIGVFNSQSYFESSFENSEDDDELDAIKDKIIIADDNEDMRDYLTRLLKSKYKVIAVKDGIEALEAVEKEKPALILSDIMMPKLDGFGLVKELKARNTTKSIPVIFLSARAGEEATIEGMEAGADDYLIKPFSSKELLSRINSNIKISQQRSETEKNLRNLFDQAPVAICILKGPSLIIELANEKMLELWGKNYQEVINRPTLEVFPEIVSQGFDKILNEVYATGESFTGKELAIDLVRNGKLETVFVNFVYDPLRDAYGNIDGIVTIAVEVTDMVKAKQKLMESEAYFRMMADNTPSIIWITDPEGFCTYLNKRWYEYTGQTEDEAYGLGWLSVVHPDDEKNAGEVFMKANQLQESFSLVYRLKTKGGNYHWALDSGIPRFNSDGSFQGFVGSVVDIHERKLGEESLHSKNEQLTKINNDLDNFIYTASHDLKAPISNIEGLLNTLKESLIADGDALNDDTDYIVKLMEASLTRFKTTILDLTEISKVQKLSEIDIEEISFSEILEDTKVGIREQIIQSGATIKSDFSQENKVRFSRKNVKSVLYNLLSNAIKYRDPNKTSEISVTSAIEDNYTIVTFRDNGLGISKRNQEKMFSMFKRFHTHVEGTGIGLYIVKKILDNEGGKIEVDSEEGKGTTFKVYFKR